MKLSSVEEETIFTHYENAEGEPTGRELEVLVYRDAVCISFGGKDNEASNLVMTLSEAKRLAKFILKQKDH